MLSEAVGHASWPVRGNPEIANAGETFKWTNADKRDCLDATFHMRKTEFSQYTEAAVRFKSQLTDKAIDTSKQKR